MTRRISTLIIMAALAAIMEACSLTTPKQAASYNDLLMQQQKMIVEKYDLVLESFDTYVGSKMDAALLDLEAQIAESQNSISQIDAPSGCEALRDAVLDYIAEMQGFASDAMPRMISIYKRLENEFTPDAKMEWDSTYKDMDKRLKEAGNRLREAQKEFAKKYELTVN